MSESRFNADLDALVRGEALQPADDLTRFAESVYREEQNVTMPNALKLRMARDLGLDKAGEPRQPAPISRRTARAMEPPPRSSRPWAIALTIAAALLLGLTGILRWGMPGTDDNDSRFMMLSPAVPTVEATPVATPMTELNWLQPITAEECIVSNDQGSDIPEADPAHPDAFLQREHVIIGPVDPADAQAAKIAARQAIACEWHPDTRSDRLNSQVAMTSDPEFSPYAVMLLEQSLVNTLTVSEELAAQGVEPEDIAITIGNDHPDFNDLQPGQYALPNPDNAFALEDGRIVILDSQVIVTDSAASGSQALPAVSTAATVIAQEDGEWKVDDYFQVCVGDCNTTLSAMNEFYFDALWLLPVGAEECTGNVPLPAEFSAEHTTAILSRQYLACEESGEANPLQGPGFRVTGEESARAVSDEIAAGHRQNGQTPGSLQRIVQPDMMPIDEFPDEPYAVFTPRGAVQLADGRMAVLETSVISNDALSGSTGRTSPVITTALIWIQDGDHWLLDEELTVCLGNCDTFWGDTNGEPATPAPAAELLLPETCELRDEFQADFTSDGGIPVGLRPGPGMRSGVTIATILTGTELMYMCEVEETSNPAADRLEDGQTWLKVQTADGTEGWIREVDVQPIGD